MQLDPEVKRPKQNKWDVTNNHVQKYRCYHCGVITYVNNKRIDKRENEIIHCGICNRQLSKFDEVW